MRLGDWLIFAVIAVLAVMMVVVGVDSKHAEELPVVTWANRFALDTLENSETGEKQDVEIDLGMRADQVVVWRMRKAPEKKLPVPGKVAKPVARPKLEKAVEATGWKFWK